MDTNYAKRRTKIFIQLKFCYYDSSCNFIDDIPSNIITRTLGISHIFAYYVHPVNSNYLITRIFKFAKTRKIYIIYRNTQSIAGKIFTQLEI